MANKPHHNSQRYRQASKMLRDAGNLTPDAVCCRDRDGNPCGLTLAQHGPRARWTAGHTVDGSTTWQVWSRLTEVPPPGDWLALQASTCNYSAGATAGNRRRNPTTETW